MLVLSRKVGQELVIGDNIRITVSRISGNRVTLGISAPQDVRIVRGELEPIVRSFEVELDSEQPVPAGLTTLNSVQANPGAVGLSAEWIATATAPLPELPPHVH